MTKPLNVLLITADQHRGDCFGFEGRKVRTPHLDDMAEHGCRFSQCITPNVVCQPARASILTGLLPLTHGVYDNGIDLCETVGGGGFAGALARAGYMTGFVGKAHFSSIYTFSPTGRPECQWSMKDYGEDWCGPYMGFQHAELVVEGHNRRPPAAPPSGQHYERWFYSDGRGAEKNRLHQTHLPPDTGAPQTWNSALPTAWHNSTWTGDRTIEFLRRNHSKPFCLWASFPDPHSPFDCPAPWCYQYQIDEVDLPPHRTLDLDRRPWWHQASLAHPDVFADPRIATDPDVADRLRTKPAGYSRIATSSERELRHTIANYYGMISLVDHNVGRILTALDDLELADRTLVIYTSDHGEWLGDHGLLQKGPMIYEGLLRVGLLIKGAGVPAGRVVDTPVSTVDLAPTIADYANTDLGRPIDGASLRSLIEGRETGRDAAFHEWDLDPFRYGVEKPLKLRTVRTNSHKLTLELVSGAGELYDLVNDPFEERNLFDNPGAAKIKRELGDLIHDRLEYRSAHRPDRVGL